MPDSVIIILILILTTADCVRFTHDDDGDDYTTTNTQHIDTRHDD